MLSMYKYWTSNDSHGYGAESNAIQSGIYIWDIHGPDLKGRSKCCLILSPATGEL